MPPEMPGIIGTGRCPRAGRGAPFARRGSGLLLVGDADHPAELGGQLDDRGRLGYPLDVVRLENSLRSGVAQHVVELPGQVGRVTQARTHSLAGEGGSLVGGVPGQEDPPFVPSRRPPSTKAVAGVAHQRGVVGPDIPRLQEGPGSGLLIDRFEGLTWQAHELPAPVPRTARDHRGRAAGVADLEVGRIEDPWLVEVDVDNQPVEVKAAVLEGDAEQVAHRAVGTVATDDVGRRRRGGGFHRRSTRYRPTPSPVVLAGVDDGVAPQQGRLRSRPNPFEEPQPRDRVG